MSQETAVLWKDPQQQQQPLLGVSVFPCISSVSKRRQEEAVRLCQALSLRTMSAALLATLADSFPVKGQYDFLFIFHGRDNEESQ